MKKLTILFLFISCFGFAQQPFYGDRKFVSYDGLDTLLIEFEGDTVKITSTDGVYFNNLMNIPGFGTQYQIPFINPTGDDFDYSSNFKFTGQRLDLKSSVGTGNVFIGDSTGRVTTGSFNTMYGFNSGYTNVSGSSNVFNGYQAGYLTFSGNTNTFIGRESGYTNSSGSGNTYIGYQSGRQSIGSNNVFLGYQAGYSQNGSNKLYIENSTSTSPLIYGEFDNDIVKINGTQIQSNDVIADNDATPDVSAKNIWTYNGTANSVTVTDLDNPDVGAIYRIIGNSDTYTITINDGGNFNLSGNWIGGIDDVLTVFVQADNDYIEISRSNN